MIADRAALLVAMLTAVLAVGSARAERADEKQTLTVALTTDIRNSQPGMAWHTNTAIVLNHVFESLVGYRRDLSIGPVLAESFETSADGLRYTFRLRSGVRFHNGAPLAAADVVWSWQHYLSAASRGYCKSWYDGTDNNPVRAVHIVDVRAEDARTVVFQLSRKSSLFLHLLANPKCSVGIVHPDSFDARGNWVAPIGTGPFRWGQWERGRMVELERFTAYRPADAVRDGYVGDRSPLVDRLRFIAMPEPAAAISALASGDVDVVPSIPAQFVRELRAQKKICIHEGQGLGWSVLLLQTQDPLLSDVRIRRAIAHAIDLDTLARIAASGLSPANASAVPRVSSYFTAAHENRVPYDPALARKLLAQARYDGRPVVLQANRRFEDMYNNAIVIQAMLQAVGLNVRLQMMDYAAQQKNFSSGRFQLMSQRYSPRMDPTLGYAAILGSKRKNPAMQWDATAQDDALMAQTTQVFGDARSQLFEQLHERMLADVPVVGLQNEYLFDATTPRVVGYELLSMDFSRLWGVRKEPATVPASCASATSRKPKPTT